MQTGPRGLIDWVREKAICSNHCPVHLLKFRRTSDVVVVEVAEPLSYVAQAAAFKTMLPAGLASDDRGEAVGKALAAWCSGNPLPDLIQDGGGHFLLAWYWLEMERPELTRMALLDGAGHLLAVAKSADLEQLRSGPVRDVAAVASVLQAELNAYRMLLAAAAITTTPAGAAVDGGDSYLAELQVLMTAWRQSWLKCGLPESVANDAVRRIDDESRRVAAVEVEPPRDRYHFFDYRFQHGAVPDVVVARALEQELLGLDGKVRGGGAGMTGFLRSFELPENFSKASRVRWGAP